jgi:hypothetical protein
MMQLPRIENLTVTGEITRSRWSAVYTATVDSTRQQVAVKVLDTTDPARRDRLRDLITEVRDRRLMCLPSMQHCLIDDEQITIIMEWIVGLDPVAHCVEFDLEPRVGAGLAKSICESLQLLHDQGFIHRDIKPANIVIDSEDRAVFLDLESSRMESWDTVTGSGEIVGTRGFVAPEIVQGKPATVQSDVYSVGRVFELMLVHARSEAERERLKEERDPRLDAIVTKACADRPEDRYRSAAAMATDIERYLAGDSLEAMPSRTRQWFCAARRNWPLTAALACIVVLLFVVAVVSIQRGDALTEARRNMAVLVANLEMHERNTSRVQRAQEGVREVLDTLKAFRETIDDQAEAGELGEALARIRVLDDLSPAAEAIEPGSSVTLTASRVPITMDALRAMYTPPLADHEDEFAVIRRALEQIENARKPKG